MKLRMTSAEEKVMNEHQERLLAENRRGSSPSSTFFCSSAVRLYVDWRRDGPADDEGSESATTNWPLVRWSTSTSRLTDVS